jgi:hypothetical protein
MTREQELLTTGSVLLPIYRRGYEPKTDHEREAIDYALRVEQAIEAERQVAALRSHAARASWFAGSGVYPR